MQPVARFTRKLSILFGRNRFRVDLDEEMAFHQRADLKVNDRGLNGA